MVSVAALWLPIILSAVAVFIASALVHMVLPIHRNDFGKLPGEDKLMDAMRAVDVEVGDYVFPCAPSYKESGTSEMTEKYERGPCGFMTVTPSGVPSMGGALTQWFVYLVVMSAVVGYVAGLVLSAGAEYLSVFCLVAAVAFLGYAGAHAQGSIWMKRRWLVTIKHSFDGLIYALLTAGFFGWLWPR